MINYKNKLIEWYDKNEKQADLGFFIGGFIFDVLTLSDIDDTFSLAQQLVYLFITAYILYFEFLVKYDLAKVPRWLEKIWTYHRPFFHFFLGSLLSVYSLFFLKSSSFFSSLIFVLVLVAIMIGNELKAVQEREVNVKVSLHILCLFCFFSIIFPLILGFVGFIPFALSLIAVGGLIGGIYYHAKKKMPTLQTLIPQFLVPGYSVLGFILVCYLFGWIPPVPLSIQSMGIYHQIGKIGSQYVLHHEKPGWKFWQSGDQDFLAQPGDKVYFFARIYSPAKFSDSVYLHWYFKDPRQGWITTDRVPMTIVGGRREGFRGYSVKQNYSPGAWRVSVETTDKREISRLYFDIEATNVSASRSFNKDLQ